MSTTLAIVFIIGKSAIWLGLPLALGLWELRRHRKMMALEARGEAVPPTVPNWLRAAPRTPTPMSRPVIAAERRRAVPSEQHREAA